MTTRKLWTVLLLIVVVAIVAGCATSPQPAPTQAPAKETPAATQPQPAGTAAPAAQPTSGGTFVGSYYIDITSIDPHKAVEWSDNTVNPLVYEALVGMGPDGQWKGVLAESWETSKDGLTWTFKLRKGVKFHNGREFTADDVIYSIKRILEPSTGASMQSYFASKIANMEAVDPYTVKFVLKSGGGTFLSELGLSVRSAIIAKECVTPEGTITNPIGTGPFQFVAWKPGESWRAKRFDGYWGQVAKIDEVLFKYIPDNTVRLTALQTGEIDWMREIPYHQVNKMKESPSQDIVMKILFESRTERLNFNTTRPPFNDKRVRQAVAYALDKQDFNKVVWFGVGNPHNQPFAPGSFLYLNVEDPYGKSNLEKAKALMAEAGYANGFEAKVISHAPFKDDWEFFQGYLAKIGVKINVEILDSAQWTKRAKELDYDMMLASQALIYHWDRTFSYFDKGSSSNWLVGGYQNDALSALLAKARDEADLNKAKEMYTEALKIIQDDAAALFIAGEPDVQLWRSWIKGYDPNPNNTNMVWPGGGLNYITLDKKR
ncbi:MAG: ABC transporter substrate-binding protein [Chloroflexota bacterium]